MEAGLRIVVKHCRRGISLRITLALASFVTRQCSVRMNGQGWRKSGRLVSLTHLLTGRPKSVVRTFGGG